MTALSWVKNKKVKTKLEETEETAELFKIVRRAENWLKTNTYDIPLLKWDTKKWGEIPADFGRK
jgi:ribonuclease HI